jgi:PEP-CTERM motif
MWRMMPRLATSTLTFTLALALSHALEVKAATAPSYAGEPTYSYTTTGSISGMTGAQPIEFYGLYGSGTLNPMTPSPIGQFITSPLPATATLTYNNTPFVIDLNVVTAPGSPIANYDYKLTGMLNGSITGNGHSTMMAYVTSITGNDYGTGAVPPFPLWELQLNAPLAIAAPKGETSGFSTLTGQLYIPSLSPPLAAPEPASVVLFGTALAGWFVHRRRTLSKAARSE